MAEYLVRGALLQCECGSHPRKMNLKRSHGIYVNGKPQILQSDCTLENIPFFGICSSETPPKDAETVSFEAYGNSEQTVTGCQCCPDIIGKWRNCNEANGKDVDELMVTNESYLVCRCGGLIQVIKSGQELEE